ncbi:STAS domain-containing protein [Corallococcus sp. H22C18031201]|uniref:STAS domain-containing protein n=1 Tax=Citreicoccus inhibens TaxID=2849499 RepID=UPI000E742A2A|nr:STAS domain-containing protein [Citreicoccus inhibens]MBU8894832.1 STAS domain-containing protein [Citreicoccus inhibens]RJS17678.1 STAS domain-containing protein [Corallococcus sp. H22C18031201]
MPNQPSSQMLEVDVDRLERIRDVLAMISLGEFDPAHHLIPVENHDAFSSFEETINLFARQLHASVRENEASIQKLDAARRDLEEKLSTIERQRMAIRDLSTPIIELWEDILTLPIVGVVDTQRSLEMTERLLHRISQGKARCAIIDITGVEVVDTATANHFVKMVTAARLLGTYCVVTGISPVIAQTLSQIGVDLRDVKTLGSLRDGLRECFLYLRSQAAHRAFESSRQG